MPDGQNILAQVLAYTRAQQARRSQDIQAMALIERLAGAQEERALRREQIEAIRGEKAEVKGAKQKAAIAGVRSTLRDKVLDMRMKGAKPTIKSNSTLKESARDSLAAAGITDPAMLTSLDSFVDRMWPITARTPTVTSPKGEKLTPEEEAEAYRQYLRQNPPTTEEDIEEARKTLREKEAKEQKVFRTRGLRAKRELVSDVFGGAFRAVSAPAEAGLEGVAGELRRVREREFGAPSYIDPDLLQQFMLQGRASSMPALEDVAPQTPLSWEFEPPGQEIGPGAMAFPPGFDIEDLLRRR